MPPESNDNRLLLDGKDSRLGSLGACREINDGLALLPLRDSLLVDPVAPSEGSQALLTICIARRTAFVVVAQPCKICPIVLPSNRAIRMHHQSLGLNTLSSSRSTRLRLRRGKVTSWRRRRSSWSRGAWVRRCYRFIFRDPCSVCGACVLPILTGWFGGPKTEALAHCDEHELIEAGFGSLADIFDLDQKQLKRSLVAARAINWANDPSARGAYSYATLETRRAQSALAGPDSRPVLFSGEALYRGRDMGTVEAALASGLETAQTILAAEQASRS